MKQTQVEKNGANTNTGPNSEKAVKRILKRKALPSSSKLSPEKQKFIDQIHEWAYTDPKKDPKKFERLFNKIWGQRFFERK